jgi:hypothetical protein
MKLLRGGAAREAVHVLGLLGGPEGRDDEALGVAALEERASVHHRQDADVARDGAQALRVAAVRADAALEDGLPVRLVLEVLEDDVQVDVRELALAELGDEGRLGLVLDGLHVGRADVLLLAEDGVRDLGAGDALDDGAGRGRGAHEIEGRLRLAGEGDQLPDGLDDRLDRIVRELEGLDEAVLRQLVGAALDHEHVLLVADVDQVQRGREHLLDGRVCHELAVDQPDPRGRDRPVPRDVGDGERGAGAVHHRDVGLVLLVGREQDADDLDLVQEALGEERAAGAVAQARREDLLLGRPALALEVAAGEAARRVVLLAVVDGQGEPVLPRLCRRGGGGGDEDVGLADGDGDGAVGEFRERAR